MFLFNRFNYFVSQVTALLNNVGVFYKFLGLIIICCFLYLRIPYLYGEFGFFSYVFIFIFPIFLSLFINRLFSGINIFFASFIPSGTPLWISFFVGLAETISYIVRPFILIIRPFLNISIGAVAGAGLSGLFVSSFNPLVFLVLLILFFYEVFVALVHWFIVCNIISFSIDH
uniref:ATP synthase F0 subunit 6 n=1 Tax=Tetraonchus monenteron TaxID=198446 RepID=UPI0014366EE6|nr:ATP synthase F0 subunit 6 [Tetraonchus monenteron]QIH29912.1 ATP synthase F0 subunit 6 [Tetraonchus monenteron]